MLGGDGDGTWLRSSLGRSSEGKHLVHTIFGQPELPGPYAKDELSLLVFECEVLSPPWQQQGGCIRARGDKCSLF